MESLVTFSRFWAGDGLRKGLGKKLEERFYRLNMEVDLQSLFGLHVSWCAQLLLICWDPATPSIPQHWDSFARALLASKFGRHLFVTPWEIWMELGTREGPEGSQRTLWPFADSETVRGEGEERGICILLNMQWESPQDPSNWTIYLASGRKVFNGKNNWKV